MIFESRLWRSRSSIRCGLCLVIYFFEKAMNDLRSSLPSSYHLFQSAARDGCGNTAVPGKHQLQKWTLPRRLPSNLASGEETFAARPRSRPPTRDDLAGRCWRLRKPATAPQPAIEAVAALQLHRRLALRPLRVCDRPTGRNWMHRRPAKASPAKMLLSHCGMIVGKELCRFRLRSV